MKKIRIYKGLHYSMLPTFPLPFIIKEDDYRAVSAKFMFTDSCMFDLHDEDQHDVNKLFGFSIGYHHKTSFRFGWRPILKDKLIEIVGYEYHDGIRQATMPICKVTLNEYHDFALLYDSLEGKTSYFVNDENSVDNKVNIKKKYGFGYRLGTYFGGNEKAPQKILIYRKDLKTRKN